LLKPDANRHSAGKIRKIGATPAKAAAMALYPYFEPVPGGDTAFTVDPRR